MRRGGLIALGVVITLAAIFGLVAFLNSKEDSTIGADRNAPGVAADDATGEFLKEGNVVLRHAAAVPRKQLETLAEDFGGNDPALIEAGQAVIITDLPADGVRAVAWKREIQVASPDDPKLREFIEYWLGRGEQ